MKLFSTNGTICSEGICLVRSKLAFCLFFVVALTIGTAVAQAVDILWVEESWELKTGEPDIDSSAPQISMVMSPYSTSSYEYFIFTLNHHSYPEFVPGGMQIQHWVGEQASAIIGPKEGCLDTNYETITWTQRLSVADGTVNFEIKDGSSATWGTFGGNGQFKKSASTSLSSLNSYSPDISISESGVNYAGNRVSSLILTRLRWGLSDGTVHEMTAPIDVDRDLLDP